MTLIDQLEMICDWKAATERHDDDRDVQDSITHNCGPDGYEISHQLEAVFRLTACQLEEMEDQDEYGRHSGHK